MPSTRPSADEQPKTDPHDLSWWELPTNWFEKVAVHSVHGSESWQASVLHFVHKPVVEYTLMGLLVLDIIILFVELYLSAEFPSCHIIERDGISCCPADYGSDHSSVNGTDHSASNSTTHHRFLAAVAHGASGGGHHSFCTDGVDNSLRAACDTHAHPGVHTSHTILRIITLVILSTFFIELCSILAAMGIKKFMKQFWYVFDFVVVTVSLVIEIIFLTVDTTSGQLALALLIVARLWRFVRIGHGIVATTHELSTMELHVAEQYNKELIDLLNKHNIPIPEKHSLRVGSHVQESSKTETTTDEAA